MSDDPQAAAQDQFGNGNAGGLAQRPLQPSLELRVAVGVLTVGIDEDMVIEKGHLPSIGGGARRSRNADPGAAERLCGDNYSYPLTTIKIAH